MFGWYGCCANRDRRGDDRELPHHTPRTADPPVRTGTSDVISTTARSDGPVTRSGGCCGTLRSSGFSSSGSRVSSLTLRPAYRGLEGFLKSPNEPVGKYAAVNAEQAFRSRQLHPAHRAMRRHVPAWDRPIPRRVALKALGQASRANTNNTTPSLRLTPHARATMAEDLRGGIEILSEVLDEGLRDWLPYCGADSLAMTTPCQSTEGWMRPLQHLQ